MKTSIIKFNYDNGNECAVYMKCENTHACKTTTAVALNVVSTIHTKLAQLRMCIHIDGTVRQQPSLFKYNT